MAELNPTNVTRLREKAEQLNRVASHKLPKLTPHNVETLVQELRVHQIELELQCQELQRAHAEAEESRNRYRDLYESIPLGYVTIDAEGNIYDLNPVGASLLGIGIERHSTTFSLSSPMATGTRPFSFAAGYWLTKKRRSLI